ncbi:amidase [Mangrovibrevibacter kandeliae]|uniref:amidase n=1 Tax=Mangrovibrevibacter kandeliae TaxID=2968473 RepID=UPI002118F194|nr:amidase [Aurantimonas sp. CSK15Z-1]MCQ8781440.1 amidase [Aurantimonas sp. CSK15Z-1]
MSENTAGLGVRALGEAYRTGRLTPRAVVEAALARMARLEPRLNAFAEPMREAALAEADARAQEMADGRDRGPLHGVPIAIKDLIEVAGTPTGYGSQVRQPAMAADDALLVARLRTAGAVILGKTNLLEYAYGVAHPKIGQTNNPHDPSRTSGGSSGGSAAAVAAGIVPLAIGTDTGGSIRIPAAYCGIVGLKPSFGLVPLGGVFPLSWSLDHAGPLARSVDDSALALAGLVGQPMPLAPLPLTGLRIGVVRRHFDMAVVSPGVRRAASEALGALSERGATLVDISLPRLEDANRDLVTVLLPEATLIHADLYAENPDGYAPGTRSQIEAGLRLPAIDYVRAQRRRAQLRESVEALFATVDVLASPSVPFVAPHEDPEFVEGEEGEVLASGLANMTGHPAISLPCGLSDGLPVGLQLMGPLGADARLLSIAAAVEAVIDGCPPPPLD